MLIGMVIIMPLKTKGLYTQKQSNESISAQSNETPASRNRKTAEAYAELERGVHASLETYSNVHRGSGHNSMVTTLLFEQARDIVLEYLGLHKSKTVVIFCTPRRAAALKALIKPERYQTLSSQEIGLSLGILALAVDRIALPGGVPFQTGGGTTRLVSRGWVIWAGAPEKFEAGTPAIVNVIAFARALQMIRHSGKDVFQYPVSEKVSALDIVNHDELEKFSGRELLDELRKTLIGQRVIVPTMEGALPYINLDNAASTPTFMPVWNAVCQTWRQSGQIQEEIVNEVRSVCAKVLGAPLTTYDIIFTSNTTEAINLVAESLSREFGQGAETVVLNTILEHNSNDLPWRLNSHFLLIRQPVDYEGFVDLNELEALLSEYNIKERYGKKRIRLVAVSGASNVLGVFNNLAAISEIVHRYGARLLVDAAQLVAHRKVEMEQCGIDYLAFSAHKVYAPFGSGVLAVRKGLLNFTPDELEHIKSSGEENTVGVAALGKALVLLQRIGLDLIREEEQALTARALSGMAQISGITIYGIKDPDSPGFVQKGGVIAFILKNIYADKIAKQLAERRGIGVRYGCHCAHLLVKHLVNISPLLERFQGMMLTLLPKITLPGITRVSFGIGNSEEDIDTLIGVLGKIARQSRSSANTQVTSANDGKFHLSLKEVQKQMNDFARVIARKVYAQV
jgi:selenocysteine lyase/cysteine desulfurase